MPFAPDFLIAGAPKSGTTALYTYLGAHPRIFMPTIKEPHYFSSDLRGLAEVVTDDAYERLFRNARGRLTGEASASYLHSRCAIPAALARNRGLHVIVLLRNPIEAAQALHQELVYNLSEDVADFQQSWRLQTPRRDAHEVPRGCREQAILQYRSVYHYAEQLPRLFEQLPANQVLIQLFDSLVEDPRGVYNRVLEFLGVEDDGRTTFPSVNAAKALRSRWVSRAHRSAPTVLGPIYRPMKRVANLLGVYPSDVAARWNVVTRPRPLLPAAFRSELLLEFEPDIRAVEDVVGRPLPQWRE